MGLDIVEIIMRVEEEFDIEITDEEAEKCVTVGLIYQCVVSKLNLQTSDFDAFTHANNNEQQKVVWEKLCDVVADELSIKRDSVTPHSNLVDDFGLG